MHDLLPNKRFKAMRRARFAGVGLNLFVSLSAR